MLVCISLLTVYSCTKDKDLLLSEENDTELQTDLDHSVLSPEEQAKYELLPEKSTPLLNLKSPITYLGDPCGAVGSNPNYNQPFIPCAWDYYSFTANAGDLLTISVDRVGTGLDPIAFLYSGTATDCSGISWFSGGGGLTYITRSDDARCCSNTCGCFSDPYIVVTAPITGTYTLTVGNYLSCGDDAYTIRCVVEDYDGDGLENDCGDNDDDNDGCDDSSDAHPLSNQEVTVTLDGCDSGVSNQLDPSTCGSNFMDLIMDCADNANNHGQFVSCVAQLTNDWKKDGLITGAQKGAIQSCAAQSDLP